ncbi:hypothetical protein LCGC14_0278590 [marine sediment metagenome]|uniref:Peptidase S74 domain-containing protein n=1 Tax=marine sediment metagenome TaxID=412755 RepID=A0A0F9WHW6_9ZZZZ
MARKCKPVIAIEDPPSWDNSIFVQDDLDPNVIVIDDMDLGCEGSRSPGTPIPSLEGYWDRDDVNGVLYPKVLADKVMVGKTAQSYDEEFGVLGKIYSTAGYMMGPGTQLIYASDSTTMGFYVQDRNSVYIRRGHLRGAQANAPMINTLDVNSVATPPFTFYTDQDTGMYRHEANGLAFSGAGANLLVLNAAGSIQLPNVPATAASASVPVLARNASTGLIEQRVLAELHTHANISVLDLLTAPSGSLWYNGALVFDPSPYYTGTEIDALHVTMQADIDNRSLSSHNHNLADLAERSYNSLVDLPDISELHSHSNKPTLDRIPDYIGADEDDIMVRDGAGITWKALSAVTSGHWLRDTVGDPFLYPKTAGDGIAITATAKLYFDGGVDTYITEPSANKLHTVVGDSIMTRVTDMSVAYGQQADEDDPPGRFTVNHGNLYFRTMAPPPAPTAALIETSGLLSDGVYRYAVIYVTDEGEIGTHTAFSNQVTVDPTHQQINLTDIPIAPDAFNVSARKIYRTTGGGNLQLLYLVTTLNDNTTTSFVDNVPDGSLDTTDGFYRKRNDAETSFFKDAEGNKAYLRFFFSGEYSTIMGLRAAQYLTTGNSLVAFGSLAANQVTSGGNFVAIGYTAAFNNRTGMNNVSIGSAANYYNQTGRDNISIGLYACSVNGYTATNYSVGIGTYAGGAGSYTVGIGHAACRYHLGIAQVGIGHSALKGSSTPANNTGSYNVAIGIGAGQLVQSGSGNILIGGYAGDNLVSGGYNIIIGNNLDASASNASYEFRLGTGTKYILEGNMTTSSEWIGSSYEARFDSIVEYNTDAGVTIETIELKDGGITLATGATVNEIETTLTDDATHMPTSAAVYGAIGSAAMVYPDAGIALSTGTAWGTSIANNSADWNTAYGWGDHSGLYANLSHVHGNISNVGAIGSTINLPIITTTSGVLTVGSFGTGANTFCVGDDSRLSDARTPTAHAASHLSTGGDTISLFATDSVISGLVPGSDSAGATYFLNAVGGWTVPVGTTYAFENGLTESGGTVKLGGDLTGATSLTNATAGTYDFNLGTSSNYIRDFALNAEAIAFTSRNNSPIVINAGTNNIQARSDIYMYNTGSAIVTAQADTNAFSLSAYDVDGVVYLDFITLTAGNTPTMTFPQSGGGTLNFLNADGGWTVPAGGGSSTFIGLSDSPADWTGGVAGYMVMVNSTPDALEFINPSGYAINNFSGTLTGNWTITGSNTNTWRVQSVHAATGSVYAEFSNSGKSFSAASWSAENYTGAYGSIYIDDAAVNLIMDVDGPTAPVGIYMTISSITVRDDSSTIGLRYYADYSAAGAALGDRWIPDKGYVDSLVANSANWDTAYTHSQIITGNPHAVTYAQLGGTHPAPQAHNTTHLSTGGDTISLFNVASAVSGLAPGSVGVGATYYLNAIGAWSIPVNGYWARTAAVLSPINSGDAVKLDGDLYFDIALGPRIANTNSSGTVPNILPRKGDATTGIGSSSTGYVDIICASAQTFRVRPTSITAYQKLEPSTTSSISLGTTSLYWSLLYADQVNFKDVNTRITKDGSNNLSFNDTNIGTKTLAQLAAGSPGGADTNIQYNNGGAFGGSADLVWSGTQVIVNGGLVLRSSYSQYGTTDVDERITMTLADDYGSLYVWDEGGLAFKWMRIGSSTLNQGLTVYGPSGNVGINAAPDTGTNYALTVGGTTKSDRFEINSTPAATTASGITALVDVDDNNFGVGAALHMDTDGNYIECDADFPTKMPCSALALETGTGAVKKILLLGYLRDASYSFTVGAVVYVSTSEGGLTTTAPSSLGDMIQAVGIAMTTTALFFNPDFAMVERVS